MKNTTRKREKTLAIGALLCALAIGAGRVSAQTFDSGSTGADGAYDLTGTPSGTTVEFDPARLHINGDPTLPLIDPERDNVFHFTTITIPTGVTVRLSSAWTNGPVYWLAQGAVVVAGNVDLSAITAGHPAHRVANGQRMPSIPGPGGYPGGIGGGTNPRRLLPQPGAGPGGGLANPNGNSNGANGTFSGSAALIPLVGGSGGAGSDHYGFEVCSSGGGAGGGAILIASSASIAVTGRIDANGSAGGPGAGIGNCGGNGSGGAIRLAAPVLQGTGIFSVAPGRDCINSGTYGRVKLEAFQHSWTYNLSATSYTSGNPFNSFVPSNPPPSLRVVSVADIPVVSDGTGGFSPPDVSINSNEPLDVVVEARQVPTGTQPTLVLFSPDAPDQVLTLPALTGSNAVSTTSLAVTFPPGFTRGYVRATW